MNAYGEIWPGRNEVNRQLTLALQRDLDQGEAESIALAAEMGANLVLLDERDGRRLAQRLGLNVIGVVGILLEAKRVSHIKVIRPHMDALRQRAGFYIGEDVYRAALTLAGE